jgi:hypothetical protein
MLFAQGKAEEAGEALQAALGAAEAGKNYALYIKLSNNLGAVLRKTESHQEGKELHTKAFAMALEHFGPAHPTATLARGNLVDALVGLGDAEGARALMLDTVSSLEKLVAEKEAQEAAEGEAAPPQDEVRCVGGWGGGRGSGPLGVMWRV